MRAPRAGAHSQRFPFRQVLSVRTAAGVQHQALADRGGRVAQAELDILAAQHIHGAIDRLFPEQKPDGRKAENFPQPARRTGMTICSVANFSQKYVVGT